jgi:hypothetical protein
MGADYSKLTTWLRGTAGDAVTISWEELDALVGGLPASASTHHPQWWHGDRPNTRAWRMAGFELERAEPLRWARFVRRQPARHSLPEIRPVPIPIAAVDGANSPSPTVETRIWCGFTFRRVAKIEPERGIDGRTREFMPQDRCADKHSSRLNPHGAGPFCSFRLRGLPHNAGVYIVVSDEEVRYVGITEDLARRWGPVGYGNISPKNCYVGGQSTNCKVNGLILRDTLAGRRLTLYFVEVPDRHTIERNLIDAMHPPWNGRQTP